MNEHRLEKAGLAFILGLIPSFLVFIVAVFLMSREWALVVWAPSLIVASLYFATMPERDRESQERFGTNSAKGDSEVVSTSLDEGDLELILESLKYTMKKFQSYDGYPSPEFKKEQIKKVEKTIDKVKAIRNGGRTERASAPR